jgi:hypothetical protein
MQHKLYRIKHLPTGMYFLPCREIKVKIPDGNTHQQNGVYVKSNLSSKGKLYFKKPSLNFLKYGFYSHLITSVTQLNSQYGRHYFVSSFDEADWVIEELE